MITKLDQILDSGKLDQIINPSAKLSSEELKNLENLSVKSKNNTNYKRLIINCQLVLEAKIGSYLARDNVKPESKKYAYKILCNILSKAGIEKIPTQTELINNIKLFPEITKPETPRISVTKPKQIKIHRVDIPQIKIDGNDDNIDKNENKLENKKINFALNIKLLNDQIQINPKLGDKYLTNITQYSIKFNDQEKKIGIFNGKIYYFELNGMNGYQLIDCPDLILENGIVKIKNGNIENTNQENIKFADNIILLETIPNLKPAFKSSLKNITGYKIQIDNIIDTQIAIIDNIIYDIKYDKEGAKIFKNSDLILENGIVKTKNGNIENTNKENITDNQEKLGAQVETDQNKYIGPSHTLGSYGLIAVDDKTYTNVSFNEILVTGNKSSDKIINKYGYLYALKIPLQDNNVYETVHYFIYQNKVFEIGRNNTKVVSKRLFYDPYTKELIHKDLPKLYTTGPEHKLNQSIYSIGKCNLIKMKNNYKFINHHMTLNRKDSNNNDLQKIVLNGPLFKVKVEDTGEIIDYAIIDNHVYEYNKDKNNPKLISSTRLIYHAQTQHNNNSVFYPRIRD